jgi:diguanylate cyclase (GGDEF)-like protein/PAS domain S-box-containing protein
MFKKITGLRSKMLPALALGMILLFGLIFFVARTSLLQGYAKLEADKATIQMDSAKSLLEEQVTQLSLIARDNAHWDDTYAYTLKPDPAFIESTFNDAMYGNTKVNAVLIVNNQGEIIHKYGFDFITKKPWHIPDFLMQAATQGGVLVDTSKTETSGLFWTPEGVLIVSALDILDSNNNGPRRGTFILVREVNEEITQHIESILNTKIRLAAMRDDEIFEISPKLKDGVVVKGLNDKQIGGFALIDIINSDTKLVFQTIGDRKIFEQGKASMKYLYWATALAALLLAVFSWIFDKLVLKKLAHLNANVIRIGQSATFTERVQEFDGNDELTVLAQGINGMLEQLDEAKHELQFEKERAQVTLTSIADAVITSDINGCVVYMNKAAESLTGITSSYAVGKPLQALFHLMTADKTTSVNSQWLTNPQSIVDEVLLGRSDGQEFILSKSASPLHDKDGGLFGTVTVLHDVTLLRMMSSQLSHQARFDALTGLANRYEFDRKAQTAIDDAQTSLQTHCVAYLDLDKFKVVNDTCGHMAGDIFLKQLANQMQIKLRSSDTLARLGGDEFALLLMGCSLEKANQIVHDLLKAIQAFSFEYEDKVFKVGASIGLTEISPKQKLTLSELLATADSACYGAKRAGGNCVHEYQANDGSMEEKSNLLGWVSRINIGLQNNQFVLFTQPLQGLKAGAEPHCELLIRMKGEDGMLFPPSTFLPAAERYNLMPQIDRWVINEALRIIADKGKDFNAVCAINLSGQSLSHDGFLDFVLDKIEQHGINTQRICFEITETAVISNLEKAQHFMRTLRAIGCRFSLDDFGSGLSSFAYLKNLEVDFLKIDGMFIKNIVNNKIDRAMVESINNVGHVMGLDTVGEFAENQEIIDILNEIGVDYAQGYGVAMPVLFE